MGSEWKARSSGSFFPSCLGVHVSLRSLLCGGRSCRERCGRSLFPQRRCHGLQELMGRSSTTTQISSLNKGNCKAVPFPKQDAPKARFQLLPRSLFPRPPLFPPSATSHGAAVPELHCLSALEREELPPLKGLALPHSPFAPPFCTLPRRNVRLVLGPVFGKQSQSARGSLLRGRIWTSCRLVILRRRTVSAAVSLPRPLDLRPPSLADIQPASDRWRRKLFYLSDLFLRPNPSPSSHAVAQAHQSE